MTVKSNSNFEFEFFTWLKTFLNDKGLQFSRCGLKTIDGLGARHEFDLRVPSRMITYSLGALPFSWQDRF